MDGVARGGEAMTAKRRNMITWKDTVLSWEEFYLIAKANDYDFKFACEAQAKKSFELGVIAGYEDARRDFVKIKEKCESCGGTGEIPVPAGDYPLSVRMRPCPDCKQSGDIK